MRGEESSPRLAVWVMRDPGAADKVDRTFPAGGLMADSIRVGIHSCVINPLDKDVLFLFVMEPAP
jgi:hypothetical protein